MTDKLLEMTTDIVSSYVSANEVNVADLPALIRSVFQSLNTLGQAPAEADAASAPVTKASAAAIRKSITPNALISFIDGRPYKMLKRHLTNQGLTVADYKAKFGLPDDYPITAPAYSEARSKMAISIGLGRGSR